MAKNKTAHTAKSVDEFIRQIDDEGKRDDAYQLTRLYKETTGFDAVMYGPSIIGFGTHHYKYASGHEGDMPLACFAPRKSAIVLYLSSFDKKEEMLKKLGKHKITKGCVYIKTVKDIDVKILKQMIVASVKNVNKAYPSS